MKEIKTCLECIFRREYCPKLDGGIHGYCLITGKNIHALADWWLAKHCPHYSPRKYTT